MADDPTPQPAPTPPTPTPTPQPSLGNTSPTPPADPVDPPSLANTPEPKPDDAPKGAPEKYEFKAPDGMEFTEESLAKATPIFKELGLNNEGAQKLMDLYAAEVKAVSEGPVNYWLKMQDDWKKEITADSKYGDGNGGLKSDVKKAISDVKAQLPPDIKKGFEEAMDLTGAGNNPFFIKALNHLAAKLTESTRHASGGGPAPLGQAKPGAATGPGPASMYPDLPSAQRG